MTTTSTFIENREQPEQVLAKERRVPKDKRRPVESKKVAQIGHNKKYSFSFSIIISILVPLISLAVYDVLGLYDGVNSINWKIGFAALFLCVYFATRIASD